MSTAVKSEASGVGQGVACPGCHFDLPLRAPEPQEASVAWECTNCRATYSGTLRADKIRLAAQRVRLADSAFTSRELNLSLTAVAQFVRQISQASTAKTARGSSWSLRTPERLEAVAVGLDAEYRFTGEVQMGAVTQLSPTGMYLLTTAPIEAPVVVVQMIAESGPLQLLGRVELLTNLPRKCCGANIEFVARLGNGPDV